METPTPSLEAIMAGLAAGDVAFLRALHLHHGDELRRFLLGTNRRLGLPPLPPDDVDGLVWDACEVVAGVAGSWRPDGGARPWVYARARIEGLLRAFAGPPTRPYDGELDRLEAGPPVVGADDPPAVTVLDRLVRDGADPVLALFQEALGRVVPAPENRELVLRYAEQLAAADPAPASTVGRLLGRPPVNVRQMYCRVRRRLVGLAMAEPRYRPLLTLPLLAADGAGDGLVAGRPAGAGGPASGTDREAAA